MNMFEPKLHLIGVLGYLTNRPAFLDIALSMSANLSKGTQCFDTQTFRKHKGMSHDCATY